MGANTGDINVTIDGYQLRGKEGDTILDMAKKGGIEIPTLCHQEGIRPSGNCRICVVDVEGSRILVGSCHTPIIDGMVIHTSTARVLEARRATIKLLLAGHTGPCVTDVGLKKCELHKIASHLEVGPPEFRVEKPRFYTVEDKSSYIWRDMSKCILCRKCIRACSEVAGQDIYSMAYRGFNSKVVVDCDVPLNKEVCKDCGICIEYCPTSALIWPEGMEIKESSKKKNPQTESAPENGKRQKLLHILKEKQRIWGHISEEAITEIAGDLDLPVGEVYGVATFYTFISTRPQGKHVLKICKSLPCYLKDSPMILESVKKVIGIEPGETTPDGLFSFELTNCIGACDQAPAMLINDKLYGNLTPAKVLKILKSHQ